MDEYTTEKTKGSKNLPADARNQPSADKPIHLHHSITLSRKEFDEGIGKTALMLLDRGKLDLKSTKNVEKYIFEFEIID